MLGIDSAKTPIQEKTDIWNRFANDWKISGLEQMCHTVTLEGIIPEIDTILAGAQTGRELLKL
ncbi:MAG: hypothetical protein QF743_02800 [Candidatus Marinimicrobia bacterium]|nr:hypothetical protein [Candidatus Neomarinimicrobiota bacterium]